MAPARAACILLALLMALPAAAQVTGPGPIALGTDAEGDDIEAAGSVDDPGDAGAAGSTVVPSPGNDLADIDDIVGMSVAATTETVRFRLDVAQRPEDAAALLGTFCWVAAFQVGDDDQEYLALGCTEYGPDGSATDHLDASSSRGMNVVDKMAWDATAAAVDLWVSRDDIGAAPGAVLTDVYGLTYMGDSLSVDDAAPDAKTDRDASDSFGEVALDGSAAGGAKVPYVYAYHGDVGNATLELHLDFTAQWTQHVYNWTTTHDRYRIYCNTSAGAPAWTLTITKPNVSNASFGDDVPCMTADTQGWSVGHKGLNNLTLSLRKGSGSIDVRLVPVDDAPATSSTPTALSGTTSSTSKASGTEEPSTSSDAPTLPLAALLAAVAAVAWARRRLA